MNCIIFAKKSYKKQNERKSWELTVCAVAVCTTRGTSFFGWNVKNISKFCQMITCYGIEMPYISKEPFNQEVFWKMVGFLTDVSNKMSSFKNWSKTKFWAQFTNITFGKFNIGTATLFISHSYCLICIRPVKHVKFCPINILFCPIKILFCPINVLDVKLRLWNNISTFVWLRFVFGIFRKTFD